MGCAALKQPLLQDGVSKQDQKRYPDFIVASCYERTKEGMTTPDIILQLLAYHLNYLFSDELYRS
jgi:hypothetical protein